MAVLREVKSPTGVTQMTNKSSSNSGVIVLDQKDDAVRKEEAKNIRTLAELLVDSNFNISRCVMAAHDPDSGLVYNIPDKDKRDYAVINVFAKNGGTVKDLELEVKKIEGYLITHKYKAVAKRIFTQGVEYPTAKIIVKCVVPTNVAK